MASDLPFYDIFAPQKITFSKISDDVIACDLWFGPPPQSKILATPMMRVDLTDSSLSGLAAASAVKTTHQRCTSLKPPCVQTIVTQWRTKHLNDYTIHWLDDAPPLRGFFCGQTKQAFESSPFCLCAIPQRAGRFNGAAVDQQRQHSTCKSEMETGRVAGRVEIRRAAGQAGRKTGRILISGN